MYIHIYVPRAQNILSEVLFLGNIMNDRKIQALLQC